MSLRNTSSKPNIKDYENELFNANNPLYVCCGYFDSRPNSL